MKSFELQSRPNLVDPNLKTTLFYNIATCYQKLTMLEECVDYLVLATDALNDKIT